MLIPATALLTAVLIVSMPDPASARPAWKEKVDGIVTGKSVGVSVSLDGTRLYAWGDRTRRVPASNQKLMLSMAAYDAFATTERLPTRVLAHPMVDGVVNGDLWVVGRGDPTISAGDFYDDQLPFHATRVGELADAVEEAGATRVEGSVMGSTSYFEHDWFAPGWKSYFPQRYVALPSALTIDGNEHDGRNIADPEIRLARALSSRLEARGIKVTGPPGAGTNPADLTELARVTSPPLNTLLRYTNRQSSNFFAEVLGKRLAAAVAGAPGTIAKGAGAIALWARDHDVDAIAHDASGLSYDNRVSPRGLTKLLDFAEDESWGNDLLSGLPKGGQGTLEDRLKSVRVRAKTGTLENISALSGFVWLQKKGDWASFSILSAGLSKTEAVRVENRIVRALSFRAH